MGDYLDGTLAEAVEMLAARAADLRTREFAPIEKSAAGDFMSSLGDAVRANPVLAQSALGSVAGAGLGGLGAAYGNRGKDPSERRGLLGSALTGGLAGAGIGAGVGLARHGMAGLGQGPGAGGEAMPHGSFEHDGQKYQIDPAKLRANPGLNDKIRQLTAPPDPLEAGVQRVGAGLGYLGARAIPGGKALLEATGIKDKNPNWLERNLPVSTTVLPKLGLGDLLMNAPGINMGERIGLGRIRPELSNDPAHLQAGIADPKVNAKQSVIDAITKPAQNSPMRPSVDGIRADGAEVVGNNKPGDVTSLLTKSRMSEPNPSRWKPNLGRFFGRDRGKMGDPIMHVDHTPQNKATLKVDPGTANVGDVITEEGTKPGKQIRDTLTRQQGMTANRAGFKAEGSVGGLTRVGPYQFKMPRGGGIAARLGLYGGVPLAEYGANSLSKEQDNQKQIRELMQQIATPIPKKQ